MRAILDANIFISYLLYVSTATTRSHTASPIIEVMEAALSGQFTILIPGELMQELVRRVPTKRYLAERISQHTLEEFTTLLSIVGHTIPSAPGPLPIATRDPKDDYLLVYAIIGHADYLVTGDADLLALSEVADVKIISPADFAELLRDPK